MTSIDRNGIRRPGRAVSGKEKVLKTCGEGKARKADPPKGKE